MGFRIPKCSKFLKCIAGAKTLAKTFYSKVNLPLIINRTIFPFLAHCELMPFSNSSSSNNNHARNNRSRVSPTVQHHSLGNYYLYL